MQKNIIPIRAFKDNYIWLFSDVTSNNAWVVDPGDAVPVIEALNKTNLNLSGILVTHHHHDHSGGVADLIRFAGDIPVYGAHNSSVKQITHRLRDKEKIICGEHELTVLEIPGHTLDHIAFADSKILFCGDTLFSAGCGRVFEGTPTQMLASLDKLAHLDDKIKIYCGHEYTLANLHFAKNVEPNNQDIAKKINQIKNLRCSLPSTLSEEKKINPFLRCEIRDVIQAAEKYANRKLNNSVEVFACLRKWKNVIKI
jgi:hydroxyacylglutathione hydrolase